MLNITLPLFWIFSELLHLLPGRFVVYEELFSFFEDSNFVSKATMRAFMTFTYSIPRRLRKATNKDALNGTSVLKLE